MFVLVLVLHRYYLFCMIETNIIMLSKLNMVLYFRTIIDKQS